MANQELGPDDRNPTRGSDRTDENRQPDDDLNLNEIPQFKKYQSSMDQHLSERDRRIAELERALNERDSMLGRYQQENYSLRTRDMDDLERTAYERDYLRDQLDFFLRQKAEEDDDRRRRADINDIVQQTGAPESLFKDKTLKLHEAWKLALEWQRTNAAPSGGAEEEEDNRYRTAANATHVSGSPRPVSESETMQRRYEEALEIGDGDTALDLMWEADRKGVILKPPK